MHRTLLTDCMTTVRKFTSFLPFFFPSRSLIPLGHVSKGSDYGELWPVTNLTDELLRAVLYLWYCSSGWINPGLPRVRTPNLMDPGLADIFVIVINNGMRLRWIYHGIICIIHRWECPYPSLRCKVYIWKRLPAKASGINNKCTRFSPLARPC